VQVDPAGQLAHLGATADLPSGVDRGPLGTFGLGQDRLTHVGVGLHAQREPYPAVAQVPGELAAAAGAVAADQDRLGGSRGGGQLGQGEVDQLDKVAGRAGSGVARPQDAS
jgi:hypothetical protein